jgi:hypothetical protein
LFMGAFPINDVVEQEATEETENPIT